MQSSTFYEMNLIQIKAALQNSLCSSFLIQYWFSSVQ